MASSNNGKGKFVNAFQSLQMIGDYEGKVESIEGPNLQMMDEIPENVTPDDFIFDVNKSHKENDGKDSLYNGEELYNPLDINESSDDEAKNKTLPNSETELKLPLSKSRDPSQNSNLNTALPNLKPNSSATDKEQISALSDISDDDDYKTEQENQEFKITKSPEQISDDKQEVFVDDVDDLLGTALAELEEEEKEEEMQKKCQKDSKDGRNKESKHKKKKKSKDKNTSDKDKRKKKKKEKKKKKSKDKTKDKEKSENNEQRKKDKRKREEGKSPDGKDLKSEKEQKHNTDNKIERERDKESRSSKDSKIKRDKSPSKKKDKKHKDYSKERKEKGGNNESKKEKSGHSSKEMSIGDHTHKDKYNNSDHHKSRKRAHREDNLDEAAKRSRKSTDNDKRTDKSKNDNELAKHTKRDRKHLHRENSPNNKKHRSRSPISSSKTLSKNEHENKRPSATAILSKEEFTQIQKEARKADGKLRSHHSPVNEKDKVLHRSSFSQNFEEELEKYKSEHHHEIIKPSSDNRDKHCEPPKDINNSFEVSNVVHQNREHNEQYNSDNRHSPSSEKELHMASPIDVNEIENLEKDEENRPASSVDFIMSVKDLQKEEVEVIDMFDVAISSQSDDGSVKKVDQKKSLKPGMLSINEYKDRRRSGGKDAIEAIVVTSSDTQDGKSSVEEIKQLSHGNEDNFDRISSSQNGSATLYDIGNFDIITETKLSALDDRKRNISEVDAQKKDGFVVKKKKNTDVEESPYNPEATPIDFDSPVPSPVSPSNAAVEDDNIETLAYKDVVAFNDIMKSKVKHEAKKHKRKKLEEMKSEMEGSGATKKEKRLVDYLIRQAQVEELMKNTLKHYFKANEITKEEYKSILKKAVPQVTMSTSSIIPEKIESLMQKFVRKCKGQRAKKEKERNRRKQQDDLAEQQKELERQLKENAAIIDSFPFKPVTALNPNLPLPPM